jgi:hypothetical protein
LLGLGSMAPQLADSMEHGGWLGDPPGEKRSSWWTNTQVERELFQSVERGALQPVQALQILKRNQEAELGRTGLVSSGRFRNALVGAGAGYGAARLGTALMERLTGNVSDPAQRQRTGFMGALLGGYLGANR